MVSFYSIIIKYEMTKSKVLGQLTLSLSDVSIQIKIQQVCIILSLNNSRSSEMASNKQNYRWQHLLVLRFIPELMLEQEMTFRKLLLPNWR